MGCRLIGTLYVASRNVLDRGPRLTWERETGGQNHFNPQTKCVLKVAAKPACDTQRCRLNQMTY